MDSTGLKATRTVVLACALLAGGSAEAVVIDIDNKELARLMSVGVPVIDIRTAPEWQQTGVVPGSHLLTFFDERGRADPGSWLEKARAVAKPGDPVVVICRTGNRTKVLSQFLSDQAGYATVYNVKDGITAWARDGRAVAPATQKTAGCQTGKSC